MRSLLNVCSSARGGVCSIYCLPDSPTHLNVALLLFVVKGPFSWFSGLFQRRLLHMYHGFSVCGRGVWDLFMFALTLGFCMLIGSSETILSCIFHFRCCFVDLWQFSVSSYISATTRFYFCQSILILVFFYLIVVAKTSSKLLKGSDENAHLCPIPDRRERVFNILPQS